MSSWRAILVFVAIVGGGCAQLFPTALDNLAEAQVRADCHFAFACCTPAERSLLFRDEDTCVRESLEEGKFFSGVVARAKAVVAAGKGEFSQTRADVCMKPVLDALNQCDAEAVFGSGLQADPLCRAENQRAFVVGNVKDGDPCDDDIECASFGACDTSTDADANVVTTAGKCQAAKALGEACFDPETSTSRACEPGNVCGAPSVDVDPTCQPIEKQEDGAPCDNNDECASGFCGVGDVLRCEFSNNACGEASDCNENDDERCVPVEAHVCAVNDTVVDVCNGVP